jgi:hypothetical protein
MRAFKFAWLVVYMPLSLAMSSLAACSEIASVDRSKIPPEAGKGGSPDTTSTAGSDAERPKPDEPKPDEPKPDEPKPSDETDAGPSDDGDDAGPSDSDAG